MNVERRTVVVTGGSAGVGRAIALKFAREGYHVSLLARSVEGLGSAKREIESLGGEAIAFPVDVSDAAAVFRAADQTVERWGKLDIWINDAMVTMFAPVADMSPEEFRRITEVTYLGCVYGTMAALKHMRARGSGTIVQIGSALAYRAIPLQSAYCGAKFAIRGFTDSLRSELIHDRSKIRLTMIQLPAVNTPQFDWARNRFRRRPKPLPPIFQPEAVADKVFGVVQNPPRELWIGFSAIKAIAGTFAAPGWLDRYLAKAAYEGQFGQEQAPADATDNLFEPASFGHHVRGRFSREAEQRVIAARPSVLHAFGAAVCTAGLAWLMLNLARHRPGKIRARPPA
jgi:NAD(P)-dependent dehydrogenase (short-subunit alcohol dehydrogenase family)